MRPIEDRIEALEETVGLLQERIEKVINLGVGAASALVAVGSLLGFVIDQLLRH